ncbi:PIF-1 [Spodoptera eridania nucleopolyhedrovirus]|uniref:PIF-1 n=1 Tax=Spodoptera eridania nucleopolyhedrovirus TaxID=2315721 RepID=A0A346TPX4_9ABAC|nr:PIF-1 [Spodoptera eridania nucleopolyhedrovirus]AXU41634.1 PIF-1 [Spodoptera eridania nucleopolyhedrovirus]
MHNIVLIVLLVVLIAVIYNNVALLQYVQQDYIPVVATFDNSDVPLIQPPTEIVIDGNQFECHKQLTPCSTHQDCDICREGLANCQYFEDRTLITITHDDGEQQEFTIEPGESYCMALDRERARSCNPNTGVWILAESPVGYALLCSCLTPGLVTQLSLYHDCDIPVGCQPNGQIISINERPMRCSCEVGYVADFNADTQTPFCRPRRIRDVIQNSEFFPQAPCPHGYIPIEHPGLDPEYLRITNARNVCVIDPCSVDPISGQRHEGYLVSYTHNGEERHFCNCPISSDLFGVYSDQQTMVRTSSQRLVNACLRPFNIPLAVLPVIEYKWFWGHIDLFISDDDVVAYVNHFMLSSPRYQRMLFHVTKQHPHFPASVNFFVMKFSTAYTPIFEAFSNLQNIYTRYYLQNYTLCFYPGLEGRCIVNNYMNCIRRHGVVQVNTAERFSDKQCILSRDGRWIRVWHRPSVYRSGRFPVALYVSVKFVHSGDRDFTTVRPVFGIDTTANYEDIWNLFIPLLNTYHHISIQ